MKANSRSANAVTVIFAGVFVFAAVYWVVSTLEKSWGEVAAQREAEKVRRPQDGQVYSVRSPVLGARYRHMWEKWQAMRRAGDQEAERKYLAEEQRYFREFPPGTTVFVSDTTLDNDLVEVRLKGDTDEYWIATTALRIQ